jgi:glucose-1-phosphate thymidylyltransferase
MNRLNGTETVGLIPAAGSAQRIQPLPWSKELLPIGLEPKDRNGQSRVRVVMSHLLESMGDAGATNAFVVLRKGKWDIPNYFGAGMSFGLRMAYVITEVLDGVPFSVDQTYDLLKEKRILFGFPDILFQPRTAFVQLIQKQRSTGADVVLGVFPTAHSDKMDMVEITNRGRVTAIEVKPAQTGLTYTWILAVWTGRFFDFLHDTVSASSDIPGEASVNREIQMGHVIQMAITAGLNIDSVSFPDGACLDLGTQESLREIMDKKHMDRFY